MRWEYRAVALWPRLGDGADAMNDTGDVTGLLNALGAEGWDWPRSSGWRTRTLPRAGRSQRS